MTAGLSIELLPGSMGRMREEKETSASFPVEEDEDEEPLEEKCGCR